MQFTNIVQLAFLASLPIITACAAKREALVSNPANELFRRAMPAPVLCGPNTDQQAWSLQSVQDAYNALVTNGALPNPQSVSPDSALLSDSQHIYHSNTGRRLKFSFSAAAGTRYYPRLYGAKKGIPTDPPVVTALDAIPECKTGQTGQKFLEFPLNMPVFTGGDRESQGPGRVIPISPSPGQGIPRTFTYCLAITHRGGKGHEDSPFRPCTIV